MISKLIIPQSFNMDCELVIPLNTFSKGFDKSQFQKTAAMFDDRIKDIKPEKDKAYLHLITTGAMEWYGANSNADSFNETSRRHRLPMPKEASKSFLDLDGGLREYHDKTFLRSGALYKNHKNRTKGGKPSGSIKFAAYNPDMHRGELIVAANLPEWDKEMDKLASGDSVWFSMGCSVESDACSYCGNRAPTRASYCFIPGVKVTKADGSLCDIEKIRVGDILLGVSGNPTKVTKVFKREVDEEVVSIYTNLHQTPLTMTKNHPVLSTPREQGVCYYKRHEKKTAPTCYPGSLLNCDGCRLGELPSDYVDAGSLRVHDYVYSPTINKSPEKWNDFCDADEAWVYGLFLAEGSYGKQGVRKKRTSIQFSLHEDETDYVERLREFFHTRYTKDLKVYGRKDSRWISAQIHAMEVAEKFYSVCGEYSAEKKIPEIFFHAPNDIQDALLTGLFDGDGHIYRSHKGHVLCSRINSASADLINSARLLAQQKGCYVYTYTYIPPGGPTNRTNKVPGYTLHTDLFKKSQGLNMQRALIGNKECGFIKKIETSPYKGYVYNLETSEHTYVANTLAVHNCDHLKNQMLVMDKEGHQVSAINDKPEFHDISGVFKPADKIAFGLRKVASEGILTGADLADMVGWSPPVENMSKTAARRLELLRKLAKLEKEIPLKVEAVGSPEADLVIAFQKGSGFGELPDSRILERLGNCDVKDSLGGLLKRRIVLPMGQFFKMILGDGMAEAGPIVEEAESLTPTLFGDLLNDEGLDEALLDGSYEPGDCIRDRGVLPEVERMVASHSMDEGPVRGRVVKVVVTGGPSNESAVKEASAPGSAARYVAREYAKYQLACLDKLADERAASLTLLQNAAKL